MGYDYLYTLQCLRESSPEALTTILGMYSDLIAGPLALMIAAIIFWCIDKRSGQFAIFSFMLSVMIGQGLKNIICQYRPWIADSRLHPAPIAVEAATGYSMPSIHTTIGTSLFGSLAVLLRKRKGLTVLMIALLALLAFTRNWLGCHTLGDVLLGLAVGIFGIVLSALLIRFLDKHPKKDIWVTVIGVLFTIAYLAFIASKSYPVDFDAAGAILVDPWAMQTDCFSLAGAAIAVFIGITVERRFIDFSTGEEISKKTRVLRAVIGLAVALPLFLVVIPTVFSFLDAHWLHFIKYLLTAVVIYFVYPACFNAVERKRSAKRDA